LLIAAALTTETAERCTYAFGLHAYLKDGDNGPEKRVEVLAAAFTQARNHLATVALAIAVRFQRAKLPAKQIHP